LVYTVFHREHIVANAEARFPMNPVRPRLRGFAREALSSGLYDSPRTESELPITGFSETQGMRRAGAVRPRPTQILLLSDCLVLTEPYVVHPCVVTGGVSFDVCCVVWESPRSKGWHGGSHHHRRHKCRYRKNQKNAPHSAPSPLLGDPQWIATG
jgi:hypothetical protein